MTTKATGFVHKGWHQRWSARHFIPALRLRALLIGSVVVVLVSGALSIGIGTVVGFVSFRDVGYPDSANLLRIGDFVHSGRLYPDIDRPPYLVTLYGPLTYVLLAIPYKLAEAAAITPHYLVRLSIVGAVCICVLFILLVSKRLHRSRSISWLCALFAVSVCSMAGWTTVIRGDFIALAFSLLGIYVFLLTNGSPQQIGAAVCSGIAFLVKQTSLAVPIAIIIWLIYYRRYKDAIFWATGFTLTVVSGYGFAWWREPMVLKHIVALADPVLEYRGALDLIGYAVSQPVVPFAAVGGLFALWKNTPENLLFVIYCVVAWLVAILTIPQVGGAINYFWEPFFASAVLAGPGLCELKRKLNHAPILITALLFVFLLRSFLPVLQENLGDMREYYAALRDYQMRKTKWVSFVSTISGRRLLSTIPDVTYYSLVPEIPDPFLNSVLEVRGRWNSRSVASQIDAGVYDLIIVGEGQSANKGRGYRGIKKWSDEMWAALARAYWLACVFDNMEVWLPRKASEENMPSLSAIGCLASKQR